MIKKIIAGMFIVAMVAAIVVGIVELASGAAQVHGLTGREVAAGQGGQGQGQNQGQGAGRGNGGTQGRGQAVQAEEACDGDCDAEAEAVGGVGRGRALDAQGAQTAQGRGSGFGQGGGQGQRAAEEAAPAEWETLEGTVLETSELLIALEDGETVQVGLGPSQYREGEGFALAIGDTVRVTGYWEGDEFKAAEVENLGTGQQIVLRDASGRPLWAGQGRRAASW